MTSLFDYESQPRCLGFALCNPRHRTAEDSSAVGRQRFCTSNLVWLCLIENAELVDGSVWGLDSVRIHFIHVPCRVHGNTPITE